MPPANQVRRLLVFFEEIDEPRDAHGLRHKLVDILFIALVAMVGGADNAEAMQEFGEAHESWFRRFLNLLRTASGKKRSIKLRRQRCGWDATFREEVLGLRRSE